MRHVHVATLSSAIIEDQECISFKFVELQFFLLEYMYLSNQEIVYNVVCNHSIIIIIIINNKQVTWSRD